MDGQQPGPSKQPDLPKAYNSKNPFRCGQCPQFFARSENLEKHRRSAHAQAGGECSGGNIYKTPPPRHINPPLQTTFKVARTQVDFAFSRANEAYQMVYKPNDATQMGSIITNSVEAMQEVVEKYLSRRKALKVNFNLEIIFEKSTDPNITTDPAVYIYSRQYAVYASTSIADMLEDVITELNANIVKFKTTGSGWVVRNLVSLTANFWQLNPLRGSSYHPLPKWVNDRKAVVNVKNSDNKCFQWSCLASLFYSKVSHNHERVSHYKRMMENPEIAEMFAGLPADWVSIKDIDKFTRLNPDISVNVYTLAGDTTLEDGEDTTSHIPRSTDSPISSTPPLPVADDEDAPDAADPAPIPEGIQPAVEPLPDVADPAPLPGVEDITFDIIDDDVSWNQIFETPEGSTVLDSSAPLFTPDVGDDDEIVVNRSRFRKRGSQQSDDDDDDVPPPPKRVRISEEFFGTPVEDDDDQFEHQSEALQQSVQTSPQPKRRRRHRRSAFVL